MDSCQVHKQEIRCERPKNFPNRRQNILHILLLNALTGTVRNMVGLNVCFIYIKVTLNHQLKFLQVEYNSALKNAKRLENKQIY
jgi:hypothetical protein